MALLKKIKSKKQYQYIISIGLIVAIAIPCFFLEKFIGNKVVALILLLAVSILAMLFDILPVLTSAVLSALIWNFFFIPPIYQFNIGTPEDVLLFMMYFAIATLNAVLTSRIKKADQKIKEKEEREKTIKLYNTLLNSLSHELRTPIATIIGAVDTLKETSSSKLSEENQAVLLSEINIAGIRLNRQVENLLGMSRLESGFIKPKLDWCDMNELVHKVIRDLSIDSDRHHFIFKMQDHLPLFKLDRGLMEQVLFNILHNAILYTPPNTNVEIQINHNETSCVINITDNGPGFPENKLEHVFEKFYRIPNTKTGGTGLGLSIVRGFIEAHNGTVRLENRTGNQGARFTIIIPTEISCIDEINNE